MRHEKLLFRVTAVIVATSLLAACNLLPVAPLLWSHRTLRPR